MDLWVAAAAAGAGYLAKYWQNTLEGGESSKHDSLNSADEKPEVLGPFEQHIGRKRAESGSHLFRSLIRRQAAGLSSDADERHSEGSCARVLPERTDPSKSAVGDKLMRSEEYVRDDSSLLSLQPWIFRKEIYQGDGEQMKEIGECPGKCDYNVGQYANALQPHLSPRNAGPVYGFRRNKSSLRSRKIHKYSVKPWSSTENCLIPQLYKDNIDFEEYVFCPFPSPSSPAVRPFLVTDGKQIISKSSFESLHEQVDNGLHQHVNSVVNKVVIGVPPLQISRKPKRKCEESHQRRLNIYDSQHCSKMSQLPDVVERVLFFCLGLNVGVMSNFQSNNRVVEKLSDLLKHSENLVQDLQEELEMKNSLVVEELVNQVSQDDEHHDIFHDNDDKVYSPPDCDSKFPSPEKQRNTLKPPSFSRADVEKEPLSTIEAELEAELERLELNMNAFSLEGRISALAELDPRLTGNVVHGELREDILNGKSRSIDSDGDTNGSSTTPHMGNYSVSPRELSLRLHEIIQSQLEERIKDLETALYLRGKQLHSMEDEKANSRGEFSSSEQGTSSNQESPVLMDQGQDTHHPLCLNLSGDALDAYDEAYEEFLKMTNADEENPSSTTNMSGRIDGDELCSSDQSLSCGIEVGVANETSNSDIFGSEPTWKHIRSGQLSSEAYGAEEVENDEIDGDEEGKMLIQQIVERTRQGSPIVINAQKILSLWTNN
ncbi:hypothetical protein Taro_031518 [Colocasia esculenta]|uniref:Uncharacterized protein n=1 Tax=Colocasia esculenta TaxID=4460 RepID=A0A843VQ76_COLES|nr:hypothetical protein [Colocasia esculenta]